MKAKNRSMNEARNNKRHVIAKSSALLLGLCLGASCELVLAGPTGGEVVGGEATIGQEGSTTTINQNSQRLMLQWQTFNVAADENVLFNQPGTTAVALNRILDQNASQIFGAIDANGRVFLINPNGIIFGETATVNVGALVASSLDIDYDDFMAGNYDFEALADGSGEISGADWKRPVALDLDRLGNLYVLDRGNGTVEMFDAGGRRTARLGLVLGGGVELRSPADLAVDGSGRLFIADNKLPFVVMLD